MYELLWYGFDKTYMDKDLIEDKLYKIMDKFNERKIMPVKFYSILLNKMHPLEDRNDRTCKILFMLFKSLNYI